MVRKQRLSKAFRLRSYEDYADADMRLFLAGRNGTEIPAEIFGGDVQAARAFYEQYQEEVEYRVPPGERSDLWWYCMAPEPLCIAIPQELHLWRLGILTDAELGAVAAELADDPDLTDSERNHLITLLETKR